MDGYSNVLTDYVFKIVQASAKLVDQAAIYSRLYNLFIYLHASIYQHTDK